MVGPEDGEERLNYLAKLGKKIADKYGEEAAANIRSEWDEEKEGEYLEQLKAEAKKEREYYGQKAKTKERILITRKGVLCSVCGRLSLDPRDGAYKAIYECCRRCYLEHVQGEEDRWEEKKKRLINDQKQR